VKALEKFDTREENFERRSTVENPRMAKKTAGWTARPRHGFKTATLKQDADN